MRELNLHIQIKGKIPLSTLTQLLHTDVHGKKSGGQEEVPIEVENFKGNRLPNANDISKYLKTGFNWGLYGSPLVARIEEGPEKGKLVVYDGGHRKAMYEIRFPDLKTFPATVIDVKDMQEVARLFHRINGTASKKVNNETRFINQFLGDEFDDIGDEIDLLENTDVVVMQSETSYAPDTIPHPKWKITSSAISQLCKIGKSEAEEALNIYKKSFGSNNTVHNITGQIVKAFAHIIKVEKTHFENNSTDHFSNWIKRLADVDSTISSWLYKIEFPHDRMERRHQGTACGIWKKYCHQCIKHGVPVKQRPNWLSSNVLKVYDDYNKSRGNNDE